MGASRAKSRSLSVGFVVGQRTGTSGEWTRRGDARSVPLTPRQRGSGSFGGVARVESRGPRAPGRPVCARAASQGTPTWTFPPLQCPGRVAAPPACFSPRGPQVTGAPCQTPVRDTGLTVATPSVLLCPVEGWAEVAHVPFLCERLGSRPEWARAPGGTTLGGGTSGPRPARRRPVRRTCLAT